MGDHHHHVSVVMKGDRMMKVVLSREDGVRWVTSKILKKSC
jgi:catechol-2,3-dioxygenase